MFFINHYKKMKGIGAIKYNRSKLILCKEDITEQIGCENDSNVLSRLDLLILNNAELEEITNEIESLKTVDTIPIEEERIFLYSEYALKLVIDNSGKRNLKSEIISELFSYFPDIIPIIRSMVDLNELIQIFNENNDEQAFFILWFLSKASFSLNYSQIGLVMEKIPYWSFSTVELVASILIMSKNGISLGIIEQTMKLFASLLNHGDFIYLNKILSSMRQLLISFPKYFSQSIQHFLSMFPFILRSNDYELFQKFNDIIIISTNYCEINSIESFVVDFLLTCSLKEARIQLQIIIILSNLISKSQIIANEVVKSCFFGDLLTNYEDLDYKMKCQIVVFIAKLLEHLRVDELKILINSDIISNVLSESHEFDISISSLKVILKSNIELITSDSIRNTLDLIDDDNS